MNAAAAETMNAADAPASADNAGPVNDMSPEDRVAVQKVVTAGMKVMYDKKSFPLLKQGLTSKLPMAQKLAVQTLGLMKLLQDKARGAIPRQILLPAAWILLLDIAKFMQDAGLGEPTPQDIAAARDILLAKIKAVFPAQKPQAAQAQPGAEPGAQPGAQPPMQQEVGAPVPSGGLVNSAQQGGM